MLHEHDAFHVAQVVRAVLEAKAHDPLRSALGLALFAQALAAGEEQAARTTLALSMLELALELDPDLAMALWWH
jgi:hypothetical protein